ncbi:hypothetical protein D805_0112 [Bifidobacterium thermophilum RBL67]|uniref:Uncharacterized protein n=1 Tax=Bifidobacterium thermophilum RBL67 TaxID=1254439 RepID=M4RDY8_9BIFI|nr:hypothetical protein D805_0112 [Bifidobacterium thermophilum RBL67]
MSLRHDDFSTAISALSLPYPSSVHPATGRVGSDGRTPLTRWRKTDYTHQPGAYPAQFQYF